MTPPKSQSLCRFCGHALPQDAPRGFCPACLLHLLGDEQSNAKAGAEGLPAPDAPCAAIDSLRRAGDYEIHGEIDSGGMGVVYLARQISLNRAVALKMIRSGNLATATEIQLFKLEAGAAAA